MSPDQDYILARLPTYSSDEAGQQLRAPMKALPSARAETLRQAGAIFGIKCDQDWRYPRFQFKDGMPRPEVAVLLRTLAEDPAGWDRAYFFCTPNAYLGDRRPMDVLDRSLHDLTRVAHRHANPAEVF